MLSSLLTEKFSPGITFFEFKSETNLLKIAVNNYGAELIFKIVLPFS